jgi:hypothetical protein
MRRELGTLIKTLRVRSPYTISIYVSPHRPATWAGSRAGPPVS